MSDSKEHFLWHQSGVSATGEPFVQLLQDQQIIAQMSPEQARDHAAAIIESAEAAEQDAFLVAFGRDKLGDVESGMRLVMAFREFRAERSNKSQGPLRAREWVMPPPDKMPDYFTRRDGGKKEGE